MPKNVANNLHRARNQTTEGNHLYASTAAVKTNATLIQSQYTTKQGEVGKKFDQWYEVNNSILCQIQSSCRRPYIIRINIHFYLT